jgi:hypothetical protein
MQGIILAVALDPLLGVGRAEQLALARTAAPLLFGFCVLKELEIH